jgi:hypothetical protein
VKTVVSRTGSRLNTSSWLAAESGGDVRARSPEMILTGHGWYSLVEEQYRIYCDAMRRCCM